MFNFLFTFALAQDVRLSSGVCPKNGLWSSWLSRDLPSGTGDWETLALHSEAGCFKPVAAEGRIVGTTALTTTESVVFSPTYGLVCQNADQPDGRCEDYEIRFCCEPEPTELVSGECLGEASWGSWLNRDAPSGTGDWEIRSLLDTCEAPIAAEARIVGTTVLSTNEIVTFSASHGLSCVNADQPDRRCQDYEIRFCCEPAETSLAEGDCPMNEASWSNWLSRDLPSGTGDWELRMLLAQQHGVCNQPIAAEARVKGTLATTTTESVTFSASSGLVCQNLDQPDGRCEDYEIRFCCKPEETILVAGECRLGKWSVWNSRDLPSGTGDWELLSLHTAQYGICEFPIWAEARVVGTTNPSTTEIVSFSAAGGLVCQNADQPDGRCEDYEIRFCCAPPTPAPTTEKPTPAPTVPAPTLAPTPAPTFKITDLATGSCPSQDLWTTWKSRDFPSGYGDYETLPEHIRQFKVCTAPIAAEARILGTTALSTNEIVTFSASHGLSCVNADQPDRRCQDYEIRFCCEPEEPKTDLKDGDCPVNEARWSNWLNRDNPFGTGDWELTSLHVQQSKICRVPIAAEARIVGTTALTTTEIVSFSAAGGLVCQNQNQPDRRCQDYEIRFCCPAL